MNKKIIFLILILLSFFIDVKALDNVLEIAGTNYVLNKDINEKEYSYTISNNTLVLNNYKGSHIYKEGELNVVVKGDNYLSDPNGLFLIRADDLTISGDGTLNFDSKNSAISATDVTINDVVIKGTSTRELIYSSNELNINNVDINFNAGGILIFGGNIININNSIINSNNRFGFRYTTGGIANINNSDINMECSATCLSATAKMIFNNTNAYFYGKTSASSKMEFSFINTDFVISEDGINYRESLEYNDYSYLKTTATNISSDSDFGNVVNGENNSNNNSGLDDELDNNDNLNDDQENKDKDESKEQEDSVSDSEDISNEDIVTDNNSHPSSDKDNSSVSNSKNDNSSNESQNDNLNDNLESGLDNNDVDKEKQDNNNDSPYTKGEYNDNDNYTKNEYDKDEDLNIENPKTYDGVLNSIFSLIFSLIGIITLTLLIKRRVNGKI